MLLGFSQIQKVLVFQLHGLREFLTNYSADVIRSKKSTRYEFTGFVRVFHKLHCLRFFLLFLWPNIYFRKSLKSTFQSSRLAFLLSLLFKSSTLVLLEEQKLVENRIHNC